MPTNNQFAHHNYSDGEPAASYEWLGVPPQPRSGSAEYVERMRRAGQSMRDANVGAIVLVHGTFSGDDPTGLNAMLLGGARDTYRRVCRLTKRAMDAACRDIGNFPRQYAENLQSALRADGGIPVHRFIWSGMNNHVGRAVAAVQLAGYLNRLPIEDGRRVAVYSFSHGGNVLALLTNLLATKPAAVARFLETTGDYANRFDSSWADLCDRLRGQQRLIADNPLDLVTMGMPIRYGFDTDGYSRLLHFVNHRPSRQREAYRTAPPRSVSDVLMGRQGDYVQQFGVAGSNFSSPLHWPMWTADRHLAAHLSPELPWLKIVKRVRIGMRVPEEGHTLLCDYRRPAGQWLRDLMGHGVYTHRDLILFHTEQIVRCLYNGANRNP